MATPYTTQPKFAIGTEVFLLNEMNHDAGTETFIITGNSGTCVSASNGVETLYVLEPAGELTAPEERLPPASFRVGDVIVLSNGIKMPVMERHVVGGERVNDLLGEDGVVSRAVKVSGKYELMEEEWLGETGTCEVKSRGSWIQRQSDPESRVK